MSKKTPSRLTTLYAPAVVRKWKRGMAVGCSHGHLIDVSARKAVLAFAGRWKPHLSIHLGDFCDMTAFMRGGNADTRDNLQADFDAGLEFLHQFHGACGSSERVTFCGNHEDRLWKLAESPREVVAFAAAAGISEINDACKEDRSELVQYDNISGWRTFGGCKFGHGYMFNEMFIRDHAEAFGKCVIAHGHKAGAANARRSDGAVGYCVGTLANIPAMKYAKTNRARLSWSQGFVYFEYCDTDSVIWLIEKSQSGEWRMPV